MKLFSAFLLLFLCPSMFCAADKVGVAPPMPTSQWRSRQWPAHWITLPAAPRNEFGVYLFRKRVTLASKPERFVVHVTADARYRLFVNGKSVTFGPQRSDAWITRYETLDLAPWLNAGDNVIAARVVSYGELAPYSVVGTRLGLLVQGDSEAEAIVNSNDTWKVAQDEAYSPIPVTLHTYIVIGPGIRAEGSRHPWDWEQVTFDDRAWANSRMLGQGSPSGWGTDMDHSLAPRTIPLMEEKPTRFTSIRRSEGVAPSEGFVAGSAPLEIPAHSKARVLLDHGVETNAFPKLVVTDGAGAKVRLVYAEALIDDQGNKGNRDEVAGRHIDGVADEFIADGGARREFSPLEFRTYRYVQLEVETADRPLTIEDISGDFTGYPFVERAKFESDDPSLKRIWDVGWRTARLCAGETYFDCPYYEQLQYVGDTRIQALISLYVSGDDRLMRNAIELYDRSRFAEGLTQSRYPSATPQVINTFSLFWIEMVHDYWMHRADDRFVSERLPGIETVLAWFERRLDPETGLLGGMKFWTFVDWTDEWKWDRELGVGGEPDGARSGGSSIVSLQLAGTLQNAAKLFRAYGRADRAQHFESVAEKIKAAAVRLCWDESRRMFADTPQKNLFSQHANTVAVLSGAITGDPARDLMERVVADPSLIQSSTYFRFYLLRALKRVGLGDRYVEQLGPWRTMLGLGLTTFAEKLDPTRSDCHAWSASPIYEMLATVCGIEPDAPGFSTVRVEPHLGTLTWVSGTVPHPRGDIAVSYEKKGAGVVAKITLPDGVGGNFWWKGQSTVLHAGEQTLDLR
jgi:hypothetical protein